MCKSLANLKLSRESRAAVLETELSGSVEVLSPGPGRMRGTRSKSVLSIGPPAPTHQVGVMVSRQFRAGHYFLLVLAWSNTLVHSKNVVLLLLVIITIYCMLLIIWKDL